MKNWNMVVYTAKGLALLSKLTAESTLTITRILSGAGMVPEEDLRDQTAVTGPRQQLWKYPIKVQADARAEIPVLLRNTGVTAPYTAHQIGVYALDPDEGEILFFLAQDAMGEEVPAEAAAPLFSVSFAFLAQFGDASRIVLQMAPEDALSPELAETLFAPIGHVDEDIALVKGVHGFRYNETDRMFEKRDKRTGTWIPIAVGAPRLQGIAITTPPARGAYCNGEVFDPGGMVVTASYSQSVSAAVTGYRVTPGRPLTVSDSHVTVSFTEDGITKTAQQPVTVGELIRIDILMPPYKTDFVSGFPFDPAGMVVQAAYANGSVRTVTEQVTYSPSEPLTMDDDTVTVSYTEDGVTQTADLAIAVLRRLTGIVIFTAPVKTEYKEGEVFSARGMAVQAVYCDGSSSAVADYTCLPAGPLDIEDDVITVSYTENGVTIQAEQPITIRPAVSPVFGENSWDVIGEQARLIAAGGPIPQGWKLGDMKASFYHPDYPYIFQIVGFNMDTNSDTGEPAGISLMTKDVSAALTSLNTASTPGFSVSYMFKMLNTTLYDLLPKDLKKWIVPTTRYQTYGYMSSATTYTCPAVWFPFPAEVGYSTSSWPHIPFTRYPLFMDAEKPEVERRKYPIGTSYGAALTYWTSANPGSGQQIGVSNDGSFGEWIIRDSKSYYCIGVCLG